MLSLVSWSALGEMDSAKGYMGAGTIGSRNEDFFD